MNKIAIDDITVDFLDEVEAERKANRIRELTRGELIDVGKRLRTARAHTYNLELEVKLKVYKLLDIDFDVKEVAELLNISTAEIRKWNKQRGKE